MGSLIVFGVMGNVVDSPLAHALTSVGGSVVNCATPGEDARGDVAFAMLSALCMRHIDIGAGVARTAPGSLPVVVATARPELLAAGQQLINRGFDIVMAAPLDALSLLAPSSGDDGSNIVQRERYYAWPSLYPRKASETSSGARAGLKHNAPHTARPLPTWL